MKIPVLALTVDGIGRLRSLFEQNFTMWYHAPLV